MQSSGAVSVVTPVGPRWRPEFLARAAEVLRCNASVGEWLVVCDGSAPDEVRAAAGTDHRVRVLGGPDNHGSAHARNLGLAAAGAEWVYALDADDVPLTSGVDALLGAAREQGAVWSAGLGYDVAADGETVLYRPPAELAPFTTVIPRGGFLAQADRTGVYPVLCSGATLLTTSVARAAGGWDEALRTVSEDVSLIAWVSERNEGAWCDQYVMAYRKHPASLTAGVRDEATERTAWQRVRDRARL